MTSKGPFVLAFGTVYFGCVVFALFRLSGSHSPVQQTLTCLFYTFVYALYLWVFMSDPGVVLLESREAGAKVSVDLGDIERAEYSQDPLTTRLDLCPTCRIPWETGVSHCIACETCVRDIDHHCVAFGKCIARKNMPAFRVMIGGVILSIVALYVQGFQAMAEMRGG